MKTIKDRHLDKSSRELKASKVKDIEVARRFISARERAQSRQLEFNLTLGDIRRLLSRKTCYYTGLTLTDVGSTNDNPLKRTFDRLDPSKGYVKGNVVACSEAANNFKSRIEHEFDGLLPRKKVIKLVEKMFS